MNTAQLICDFDSTTFEWKEVISLFTPEQLNTIPSEGSWTAGQVLEHILKSEAGIPDVLTGNTATADRPIDAKTDDLSAVFLDFTARYQSPAEIVPDNLPKNSTEQLNALSKNRMLMRDILLTKNIGDICEDFSFPFIGTLTRFEWVWFMICHSRRHLRQARNIYADRKSVV